ncbi:sugar-transfer associated ATP-grasp domain-containing protein [Kineobactrum salinum]|uniref:Alpha-L-glutamate ligase-related protein ATP-grasp domain-containing protein n=1 Tax=Kineobactrum salinum TaxID=2708301 RepID=A0A6C0TY39_9GAMM|nr:sugar-transfer associated ATP-grasp domain-containing protein [Kineobactrum salinum]QIB64711.1 hypothetical protein G3T16_04205 [Kineobactrum salinum]
MLFARKLRRWIGYGLQLGSDFRLHRHFNSPEIPPLSRRVVEQARLLVISGINGEDYYNHGLYRPDLSFSEKCRFLGFYQVSRYFNTINPPRYDILARDKILFHLLAKALNVPVPELIGVTSTTQEPMYAREMKSIEALVDYLMEPESQNIFLKPGGGKYGEGALSLGQKISGRNAWQRLPGNGTIDLDEILHHVQSNGQIRRFMIQKRLRPHALLAEIVPDVCSTLRIMTYTKDTPSLIGICLRMGNGRGPTDNVSGGGVVISVDMETGTLGDVVSIDSGTPARMTAHPTTGIEISGKQIPGWPVIVDMVKSAAVKFSFIPCIGWDIAVTDEGPVIVEINTQPRCRPIQVANDRGMLVGVFRDALLEHDGTVNSGLHLRYAPD